MSFLDDLKAAQNAPRIYADVPVMFNGHLHILRFRQMDGLDWTAETDRHPMRPGIAIDMKYGYNFRALTKTAAPASGVRVEDEVEHVVTEEEWEHIFSPGVLTGRYFAAITDAIWALNVRSPELAVEAAKKALTNSPKSST